jgi:hypothetical protein
MRLSRIGSSVCSKSSTALPPDASLGVIAAIVLTVVIALTWKAKVEAACATFGKDYCQVNGTNPCPYTTCALTGPDYLCSLGGVNFTEDRYRMVTTPTATWDRCSYTPSSIRNNTCSEDWKDCGTVLHYPAPPLNTFDNCTGMTCVGNWWWEGCQATGNCP